MTNQCTVSRVIWTNERAGLDLVVGSLSPTLGQVWVAVCEELDNREPVGEDEKPRDSHQVTRVKQPHSLRPRVLVGISNNDVSRRNRQFQS